jgi:hypothetical protein
VAEGGVVPQADGGCLCGAVSYHVNGEMRPVVACHCGQCRKTSGHFVAATAAANDCLTIDDPENVLRWYRSSSFAERGFCSRCGSSLFWKAVDGGYTSVMAGSLNGDTGLRLESHIYTADKGDYYSLEADIPQYPAAP